LLASGAPAHANFQSVLEQYHASSESASKTDDAQGATQQKQKDSDSATALAVPQPVTPAVETPRLILPFTTSITLRQGAASSSDDTAAQDTTASPDDTATLDSSAAADPNALLLGMANTSPTAAILRSTLDLRSLPVISDTKTNSAHSGTQPKAQAKAQAQAKSQDEAPSQTATGPLAQTPLPDPSFTAPTTLEQAAAIMQNGSTVSNAPEIASASTSDRMIAYQYGSSNQRAAETAAVNRASQEPQKVSDSTSAVAAAVTVPAPLTNPFTATVGPQVPLDPPTGLNMPRKDAKALESGSAVPQDSSATSGSDSKNTLPPAIEPADNTTNGSNAGALAFAARLTPAAESQPPASDLTRPAEPQPGSQTPLQTAAPVTAKQISTGADIPSDARSGEGGGQSERETASDLFAKPDAVLPQIHTAVADQTAIPANNHASASQLSAAAQMDQIIDPPAVAPKTNNDITVRIPDSTGQETAVRFVERAGEVHVSVRTGDAEMAQTLRGGLNDLVNRLDNGGIRTEVWQPGSGSNAAFSQNDSHQSFTDPDGSNGRQYPSGSNSEQESKQQNKPRWVEELEGSIGNQNPKETPQLLWQA
jgi:hypothetical protein